MQDPNILVKRERYLNTIGPFRGNGNAKVVTGIRRCGKSSLLETFAESLPSGINMIRLNMEFSDNIELRTWQKLLEYVTSRLDVSKENILIIDEIQDVPEWEITVRDLIAKASCDIYLTGSNSDLLSSEYSTYLGGRYDRIPIMPLSFSECAEFHERYHGAADRNEILNRFIRVGGFPILWRYNQDTDSSMKTVRTLVDSSVSNDITARYGIRNVELLMNMLKMLASTVGSYVSAENIYNTLRSNGSSVSKDAVYEYLGYLEAANIVIKAETADLRGRNILRSKYKYYFTDLGIKHALIGYRPEDTPGHMENIIFTELKGRGYDVYVGRADGKEVDIVADRNGERIYLQACMAFGSEDMIKREFGNLETIDDNHPKYVVLMDAGPYRGISAKGIICCGLMEFLDMRTYGGLP